MRFRLLAAALGASLLLAASAHAQMVSRFSATAFAPSADPAAPQWKDAPAVVAANDPLGAAVPGHRTEIRSRWTKDALAFLFICPYRQLFSKPDPVTNAETNKLWDWDVAEVFIGADMANIFRYKEFEISPHGEWVDLDIDRKHPLPQSGVLWDSAFKIKTRIDEAAKTWYGEMQIPFAAIAPQPPEPGREFRINLYRIQGPGPERVMIAWQPTQKRNFHVPEAFWHARAYALKFAAHSTPEPLQQLLRDDQTAAARWSRRRSPAAARPGNTARPESPSNSRCRPECASHRRLTSAAVSVANSLAIPASRSQRSPRSFFSAAE